MSNVKVKSTVVVKNKLRAVVDGETKYVVFPGQE